MYIRIKSVKNGNCVEKQRTMRVLRHATKYAVGRDDMDFFWVGKYFSKFVESASRERGLFNDDMIFYIHVFVRTLPLPIYSSNFSRAKISRCRQREFVANGGFQFNIFHRAPCSVLDRTFTKA